MASGGRASLVGVPGGSFSPASKPPKPLERGAAVGCLSGVTPLFRLMLRSTLSPWSPPPARRLRAGVEKRRAHPRAAPFPGCSILITRAHVGQRHRVYGPDSAARQIRTVIRRWR